MFMVYIAVAGRDSAGITSYTVLDVVMPLLEKMAIRPFTIHDSFVCKETEAIEIQEIFTKKLIELYGVAPSFHVNYLIPTEKVEDDFITDWDDSFLKEINEIDEDNIA